MNRTQKKLNTTQTQKIKKYEINITQNLVNSTQKILKTTQNVLIKIVVIKNTNNYHEMKKKL